MGGGGGCWCYAMINMALFFSNYCLNNQSTITERVWKEKLSIDTKDIVERPVVRGFTRQNVLPGRLITSKIRCIHHTTGGIICGCRLWAKHRYPSTTIRGSEVTL